MLTEEDLKVLSLYTGYLFTKNFGDVHEYAEQVLGRPIFTHEFAFAPLMKELKERIEDRYTEVVHKMMEQAHD